jgi:hypothetical protein
MVEYISAEEQENCLIAQSIHHFYNNKSKIQRFTHVEIEQAILGVVALIDPFANHSQP